MSGHLKAVIILLVVGFAAIFGARLLLPLFQESEQRETSDARATKGVLTIGMDSWIGYFPLCSPSMRRHLHQAGYVLKCENDDADYAGRFRRLKAGELQFALTTVDAFLLNGAELDFPGTVVAVIDESKGGDALVAREKELSGLDRIRDKQGLKIAFTPASPSEHLLKAIGAHFDIPQLKERRGSWREETNGSAQALERLLAGDVQAAVLWEPDVSRALAEPGLVKLIGSEDTDRLIVDILVVSRDFSREHPEAVTALLDTYFRVLQEYRDRPGRLRADVVETTGLKESLVDSMLQGVSWVGLNENGALWFGISPSGTMPEQGLVETITATTRILLENGDFRSDPLPGGDPYRITNRQFVAELYLRQGPRDADAERGDSLSRAFPPLAGSDWARLKEVGTLKVQPIGFRRGTADLAFEGKQELDRMAAMLRHYPRFRILVKGHSGVRGDPEANRLLSQERADAVSRYLRVTFDVDPNRIRDVGYGASQPLPRKPGESDRAYGYRLPRVELALVSETY